MDKKRRKMEKKGLKSMKLLLKGKKISHHAASSFQKKQKSIDMTFEHLDYEKRS